MNVQQRQINKVGTDDAGDEKREGTSNEVVNCFNRV